MVVYLADGTPSAAKGAFYTIQATTTIELKAGQWSFAELEFPDELPVGEYTVVGARVVAEKAVAFRFVPVGSNVRPGGLCVSDPSATDIPWQRYGKMGEWFKFNSVQAPGIEILGSDDVAAETYDVYIDILKS